jgi:hypothetical protein
VNRKEREEEEKGGASMADGKMEERRGEGALLLCSERGKDAWQLESGKGE